MSWRDGDTAEFPAVPAGREPTHVVGPWALSTRGTDDDGEYWRDAGPDRDPVREPAAPSGRRRLLIGSAIGAAALALVVGVAVAAGAAISPDVTSADTTVGVSTSSPSETVPSETAPSETVPSETAPSEADPTEADPAPGGTADGPPAADDERPGPGGPAGPADGPPAGGPAGGPAGPGG